MKLWITGTYLQAAPNVPGAVWDLIGVFDSKKEAVRACEEKTGFIIPCELNKVMKSRAPSPDTEYPLAK